MADEPTEPTEPVAPAPDALDQSEIDRLLAEESAHGPARENHYVRADGHRIALAPDVKFEAHNFRNPVFLSEVELRRLRALHEDFVRYLSARLSLFLRMELSLKMAKLSTLTYDQFTAALPSPSHLCLFKVEPLVGVGILDINPRLALTIADRLLGGHGHSVKAERFLTEIEIALLEDVVQIILEEWNGQWKSEQELHGVIIGHESNGRFLQTSAQDAVILALTLEVNFGDCAEQIQIGVPYFTIEPLVKKIQARRQKDSAITQVVKQPVWQDSYNRIAVPVRAEWQAFELSLREIAHLRVGDVLEMPPTLLDQTFVLLNGTPKFVGTVGLDTDRVAVKLSRKLLREDSSHAKSDGRKNP